MRKIYIPTDTHNAFRECNEDEQHLPRNTDPRVHDFLKPLFDALSKKNPAWRYVSTGWGDLDQTGSFYLFKRFTIMDGDEELGEVWATKNWRTGENRYAMENYRLRATRNRGNCTETKDLKKATKLILSNMYARTLPELMRVEGDKAGSKARSAIYAIQREYTNTRDRMVPDIMAFVASNYDAFICTGSSTLQDKEKLLDTYERSQRAAAAADAIDKTGALVVERNGQFHVEYDRDKGTYHSHTLDTLPAHLKESIALLKLCATNAWMDDIGMRADAKTFYIIKGDK